MTTMRVLMLLLLVQALGWAHIKVVGVKGEISVRRGVEDIWRGVAPSDILKPEDSIRSGRRSGATLILEDGRTLAVPELAVIDLSDLRMMTRQELMLKLAMEGIRSVPATRRSDDFIFPMTTTMHGARREERRNTPPPADELRLLQLKGVEVLHENGFYATCILRAKQVLRLDPELAKRVDVRLLIADSFEKIGLRSDALSEYNSLAGDSLDPATRAFVGQKVEQLKPTNN